MIIRPSFTVLSGAAVGLVAGAAVYGAVSSSATLKPAKAVVFAVPAAVAHCAKGQKLEDGVCVIHVVRTVVVPASAAAQIPSSSRLPEAAPDTSQSSGPSASRDDASEPSDDPAKAADDATKSSEDAQDASEGAEGAAEGSPLDHSVGGAPSDNTLAPH